MHSLLRSSSRGLLQSIVCREVPSFPANTTHQTAVKLEEDQQVSIFHTNYREPHLLATNTITRKFLVQHDFVTNFTRQQLAASSIHSPAGQGMYIFSSNLKYHPVPFDPLTLCEKNTALLCLLIFHTRELRSSFIPPMAAARLA